MLNEDAASEFNKDFEHKSSCGFHWINCLIWTRCNYLFSSPRRTWWTFGSVTGRKYHHFLWIHWRFSLQWSCEVLWEKRSCPSSAPGGCWAQLQNKTAAYGSKRLRKKPGGMEIPESTLFFRSIRESLGLKTIVTTVSWRSWKKVEMVIDTGKDWWSCENTKCKSWTPQNSSIFKNATTNKATVTD